MITASHELVSRSMTMVIVTTIITVTKNVIRAAFSGLEPSESIKSFICVNDHFTLDYGEYIPTL